MSEDLNVDYPVANHRQTVAGFQAAYGNGDLVVGGVNKNYR
jgi:hypothetical protein